MNRIELVVMIELREKSDGKERPQGSVCWSQMFTESKVLHSPFHFAKTITTSIETSIAVNDIERKMLAAMHDLRELHLLEEKQRRLAEEIKARKKR